MSNTVKLNLCQPSLFERSSLTLTHETNLITKTLRAGAAALALCMTAAPAAYAQRAMAPAPTAAMVMGQDEVRYAADTAMTGAVAQQTSQIALRKASDPRVRSFAESEVMEQETLSRILMEHAQMMGQPMPPPRPDPRMAGMIADLERARPGPAFDAAYMRGQIDGHEQLLRIQESYIRGGRNLHLRHVAMLARGQITDHLKMLRDAQANMGRRR